MIHYNRIYNHSDKNIAGNWFDEIIKDADAVQHTLRNSMEDYFYKMTADTAGFK